MRTVLGVIIGYVIFAVSAVALFQLSHRAPHASATLGFVALGTIYGIVFAAIGGWVAHGLARRTDLAAPIWVAALIALNAAVSLVATWHQAAHWSQWSALILMAPAAIVGGIVGRRALRRPA
jgi:predicted membrane-bound spermidine synthase